MEQWPKKTKESGVSRIVGLSNEAEDGILEYFKEKFSENKSFDECEIEHSAELDSVIEKVNIYLKEFVKEYGGELVYIPPGNIHVIDKSKLPPDSEFLLKSMERVTGFFRSKTQSISMLIEYAKKHKLAFAKCLVHEMMHLNSFCSFQKTAKNDEKNCEMVLSMEFDNGQTNEVAIGVRRSGFSIRMKNGEEYFELLNESVIEELTKRFNQKYFSQISELTEEFMECQIEINNTRFSDGAEDEYWSDVASIASLKGEDDREIVRFSSYAYVNERKKLNELMDDICAKNKDDFSNREEVFKVFAKATLSGNILPVARLIEGIYGKGSFRELGENTMRADENIN